jgi:hypothetical protein
MTTLTTNNPITKKITTLTGTLTIFLIIIKVDTSIITKKKIIEEIITTILQEKTKISRITLIEKLPIVYQAIIAIIIGILKMIMTESGTIKELTMPQMTD